MNWDDLQRAQDQLTEFLRQIPNLTETQRTFDGSLEDIERFQYLFYEGILPSPAVDSLNAGRYVLARVLEAEFGFERKNSLLFQPEYSVSIDIERIEDYSTGDEHDAWDAVYGCLQFVKAELSRKRS
jgi:hypothetical protein